MSPEIPTAQDCLRNVRKHSTMAQDYQWSDKQTGMVHATLALAWATAAAVAPDKP